MLVNEYLDAVNTEPCPFVDDGDRPFWTKAEIFRWVGGLRYLRKADKALMMALAKRSDNHGQCFPNCQQLAETMGGTLGAVPSLDTVHRAIKRLLRVGAIGRRIRNGKRGYRISSLYTLNIGQNVDFEGAPKPQNAALDQDRLSRKNEAPKPQNEGPYIEHQLEHPPSYQEDGNLRGVSPYNYCSTGGEGSYLGDTGPQDPVCPPSPPMKPSGRGNVTPVIRLADHFDLNRAFQPCPTGHRASNSHRDSGKTLFSRLSAVLVAKISENASAAILVASGAWYRSTANV